MLKGLSSSGKYMYVHGGNASTYVNNNTGSQGVGNVRYNTSNQQFEVWDGYSWIAISMDYAQIGLNPEAESLLDWAKKKRDEELAWYELAANSEAVRIALEQLEQAKTKLELTAHLARDYERVA